jgi:hypothetical protein
LRPGCRSARPAENFPGPARAAEICHAFESQFAKERICVSSVPARRRRNLVPQAFADRDCFVGLTAFSQ